MNAYLDIWAPVHLGRWFIEFYRCGAIYRWGTGAVVIQTCQDKP